MASWGHATTIHASWFRLPTLLAPSSSWAETCIRSFLPGTYTTPAEKPTLHLLHGRSSSGESKQVVLLDAQPTFAQASDPHVNIGHVHLPVLWSRQRDHSRADRLAPTAARLPQCHVHLLLDYPRIPLWCVSPAFLTGSYPDDSPALVFILFAVSVVTVRDPLSASALPLF